MSWQAYVDSNLVGTKKIAQAALVGHNGATWATSAGFKVTDVEAKKLVAAFSNPSEIIANGLNIAGVKYLALRYDDRSLYGKKGQNGVVIVKTKQTIIIGVYDQNAQPGEATIIVERLADYLISTGF